MTKRIFCLFLALLCVVPVLSLPLFAAETGKDAAKLPVSQSGVLDDLSNIRYNGVIETSWDKIAEAIDKVFATNSDRQGDTSAQIVSFLEYGFDSEKTQPNFMSDLGLYVYICVDSAIGKKVDTSATHTITLGTLYNQNDERGNLNTDAKEWMCMRYTQYTMHSVGAVDPDGKYYKFRIDIKDEDGRLQFPFRNFDVKDYACRRYDIGEVELNFTDASKQSYGVKTTYFCEGFQQGYNGTAASTYKLSCAEHEVVSIEPKQTSFLYDNIQGSAQTQVSSVYFAVSNRLIEEYGIISAIHAVWEEYHSTPIVVTSDPLLYVTYTGRYDKVDAAKGVSKVSYADENGDTVYSIIGRDISNWQTRPERSLLRSCNHTSYVDITTYAFDWVYNLHSGDGARCSRCGCPSGTVLSWLVPYGGDEKSLNSQSMVDGVVSSEELELYFDTYTEKFGRPVTDLYKNSIDEVRKEEGFNPGKNDWVFYADKELSVKAFDYENGFYAWLNNLFGTTYNGDPITNNYIQFVDAEAAEALVSMSDETLSKEYFVGEFDVNEFRAYCVAETAKDNTVVVFHFAATEFSSEKLSIGTNGPLGRTKFSNFAYKVEQTLFLNFDVIDMAFTDEETGYVTVLPVAQTSMNVFGDAPAPDDMGAPGGFGGGGNFGFDFDGLKGVVAIVLVLALVVIFLPILIPLLQGVLGLTGAGIRTTGRGLSAGVKALKNRRKRK